MPCPMSTVKGSFSLGVDGSSCQPQEGKGFTCDFSRGSLVTSREEGHL